MFDTVWSAREGMREHTIPCNAHRHTGMQRDNEAVRMYRTTLVRLCIRVICIRRVFEALCAWSTDAQILSNKLPFEAWSGEDRSKTEVLFGSYVFVVLFMEMRSNAEILLKSNMEVGWWWPQGHLLPGIFPEPSGILLRLFAIFFAAIRALPSPPSCL